MRAVLLALALTLSLALAPPALAGFEEGFVAYTREDYKTAHRELLEGAEQDETLAQLMLASMYYRGVGVQKDNGKAKHWFYKAAKSLLIELAIYTILHPEEDDDD